MCDVINHKWSLKLTVITSKENVTSRKSLRPNTAEIEKSFKKKNCDIC